MAAAKDILLNEGDLDFENGDFKNGLSDNQHITDIIQSSPGAYKQFPLCGVAIINYLNSSGAQNILNREIRVQLQTDGYTINDITFKGSNTSNFTIDAIRS